MFIEDVDEEITLRMLANKDAKPLFEITDRSREYLREWLPWLDDTQSVEDSLSFIQNGFQLYAERKGLTVGVFYHDELVGIAGYNYFDWTNRIAQIGYWLSIDSQGQGIMKRVVRFLTECAFHQFDMNRVVIHTAYGNKRSQTIPKSIGYKNEGQLRQVEWLYDHYVDHIVWGMLKEDWTAMD
ncbi:MAG TPA: GNAT family protein [Virgibacillus sp.]|nr:GNAT family protein [Virgibacillus sp.]